MSVLVSVQEELIRRHYLQNSEILKKRIQIYNKEVGPRVGDWIDFPDGSQKRIAHNWGDKYQPTMYKGDTGSFYFGNGYVSYSGSLGTC